MKTLVKDYWFGRHGCLTYVLSVVLGAVGTAWYFRVRQQEDPALWLDFIVFAVAVTLADILLGTLLWVRDSWRDEFPEVGDGERT